MAFPSGDGSQGNPYRIADCTDLQAMNSNRAAHYVLSGNVDCSASSGWNGGAGFLPIGNPGAQFTGSFDGAGYTISGLTINRSGTPYVGLFGWVNTSYTIQRVGLTDVNIVSSSYGGGIAGAMENGTIDQVYTTGSVLTASHYTGGIVGYFYGGSLTNSYSRAAVTGGIYAGGLAGYMLFGSITSSYSTGSITCSSTGGIVGITAFGNVNNSFYDTQTSGKSDTGNGTPKSTADMKLLATYTVSGTAGLTTPWDFLGNSNNDTGTAEFWNIDSGVNNGYPSLRWADTSAPVVLNVSSGTANGSYKVGAVIDIDVTFSEKVSSTGNVTVTLETGDTDRTCTFTVSNANAGSCDYTVQAGDGSSDLSVNSVSGTIVDSYGNALSVTTPTTNLSDNKSIVVDTTAPTLIFSSSSDLVSGSSTSLTSVTFTLTFSEEVTGFDSSDITLSNGSLKDFTEITSHRVYTFGVTPRTYGVVQISIPAAVANDAALNSTAAAVDFSFEFVASGVLIITNPHSHSRTPDNIIELEPPFLDVQSHFSYEAVKELYNDGVIQGESATLFAPDDFLTRAEALKLVLLALDLPLNTEATPLHFSDVDSDAWYSIYVATASEAGIASGYSDASFRPDASITRAELIKILIQAMGGGISHPKSSPFTDVNEADWFKSFVDNAYLLGLIQGRDENLFAPKDFMTRGEGATVIFRALAVTSGD